MRAAFAAALLILGAISAARAGLPYLSHFHAGIVVGVIVAEVRRRARG